MTQEFVTLPREVLEQALEGLIMGFAMYPNGGTTRAAIAAAIKELRAALKQPQVEQEPVAWALSHSKGLEFSSAYPMQKSKQAAEQMARQHMGAVTVSPLYTKPQPKRTPLTDEAVLGVAKSIEIQFDSERLNEQIDDILAFARAIEAAHNIK